MIHPDRCAKTMRGGAIYWVVEKPEGPEIVTVSLLRKRVVKRGPCFGVRSIVRHERAPCFVSGNRFVPTDSSTDASYDVADDPSETGGGEGIKRMDRDSFHERVTNE